MLSSLLSNSLRLAAARVPLLLTSRPLSLSTSATPKRPDSVPVLRPANAAANHLLLQVRNFGAPKRYKGKGMYIRKKPKRPKGVPRCVREFPPPPPVINAVPKEVRRAEVDKKDQEFAEQLKQRIAAQVDVLRFDMSTLPMSDRVRKLFELTNGSQREVVKAQKERGIQLFQKREGDTGSSAVQIVALTTRIQQLQTHMSTHRKDYSSKRGLDALYVRRRKLLDYLERTEFDSYRNVAKTLGLARR